MAHLDASGVTRLVADLKARFAALAHTHAAATDITGQLPVANGGTGAATAAGARTNLDAAQDDSSGITLASAASNISTLLATTGIANTPSGKTLQGQISTLQDSVSKIVVWSGTGSFVVGLSSNEMYMRTDRENDQSGLQLNIKPTGVLEVWSVDSQGNWTKIRTI